MFKRNYESYYRSERLQVWTIWSILNHFLYLSWSILSIWIYLGLSRPILVHLGLSWSSWVYLSLFILVYFGLYWVIEGYFGRKLDISGYLRLSWVFRALSVYNELSQLLFWKSILNSLLNISNNFLKVSKIIPYMSALWPHDSLTFTFCVTFTNIIPNWTIFVKEIFWSDALGRKWRNDCFVTKWQLNFYFLYDILKYHTKLNNFC